MTINAVAFQKGSLWIAQCLEYDIVSYAETPEKLVEELTGQLESLVDFNLAAGREAFAGFSPAPERYWRLFEEARAQVKPIEPKRHLREKLSRFLGRPMVTPRLFFASA
jgi:hypothetical protein